MIEQKYGKWPFVGVFGKSMWVQTALETENVHTVADANPALFL